MTMDFFLGQLRLALVAALAYAGGRGWLTPTDSGFAVALITSLGPIIGPWIWSVYVNINGKIVPQHALVVDPIFTAANADKAIATVQTSTGTLTGKLVGALAVLLLGGLLLPGQAQAKTCIDPLNKIPVGCTPRQASPADPSAAAKTLLDLLSQPLQDLANFISSDFTQAAALTNSIPNMPDGNGNSCWNLLLSSNAIFKENPVNQPLPGLATTLEQLRLLGMVANRVCQNAACTQVFTEAGNAINSIVPIPNLPSLTTLCSKVPAIAQVAITTPAPSAAPAVTVAPVASPSPTPTPTDPGK